MSFAVFFARRWLLATLLVIAALAVMVRLGIWQLDRLEARRAFNVRVHEQLDAETLTLDALASDLDLYAMEYRTAVVTGEYLNADAVVLRNQAWEGEFGQELGVTLLTPLLIEGTDLAILVERGWIPEDDADPVARQIYAVEGKVSLEGVLRRAEADFEVNLRPDPTLAPDQVRLDAWNRLDLDRIDTQTDVPLLPVYLQRSPADEQSSPPYVSSLTIELSEGPHLGYAIQWFLFAAVLAIGYPIYVQRQEAADQEE